MRKFIQEKEKEILLILVALLGITKWWIPNIRGFENIYSLSQWILSYDYGLIRRGLIGTIIKFWLPIVSIEDIGRIGLIVYCSFLVVLLIIFYALIRYKDRNGQLFRLILFFIACPATISLLARDIGRFDLFLIIITFLSMTLLAFNKGIWVIPILMIIAMFIHESFLILYVPTILATMFLCIWDKREKKIVGTLAVSVFFITAASFILYKYGNPKLGYEEFSRFIQSRADFCLIPLSIRVCYFGIKDHYYLASSSLYDLGSIANFILAIITLSPVILILSNLWSHAINTCADKFKKSCCLLLLSALSGLLLIPFATDYGRWLSATIFCNFFIIFFFIKRDIIKIDELTEYADESFKLLFVAIIFLYLSFGPFHDWEPYPYRDNLFFSCISIISVISFDIVFYKIWRSNRKKRVLTNSLLQNKLK